MYKTLITATALTGLMALSANALELGADAKAGISFDDGVSVNAGVSANADAGTAETDAKAAAKAEGYEVVASSDFVGNTVETSDGVTVGTVTDVYAKADADQRVRIEVDDASGIETPDAFWLALSADADSDGKLVLPMTLAEFEADIDAKMASKG